MLAYLFGPKVLIIIPILFVLQVIIGLKIKELEEQEVQETLERIDNVFKNYKSK